MYIWEQQTVRERIEKECSRRSVSGDFQTIMYARPEMFLSLLLNSRLE